MSSRREEIKMSPEEVKDFLERDEPRRSRP